jgi:hypothetical protein
MNITWTDITRNENPKTVATGKHLQTYEQLLQDVWTASANRTGKPWHLFPTQLLQAVQNWQLLLFLGRLLQWETSTSTIKNSSKCKNNSCSQVQMTCTPLQSHFLDLCCKSLKSRLLRWPLEKTKLGEPRGCYKTAYSPNSALSEHPPKRNHVHSFKLNVIVQLRKWDGKRLCMWAPMRTIPEPNSFW